MGYTEVAGDEQYFRGEFLIIAEIRGVGAAVPLFDRPTVQGKMVTLSHNCCNVVGDPISTHRPAAAEAPEPLLDQEHSRLERR